MKITFLGTGTSIGVPVIGCECEICRSVDPRDNRLRASILWEVGNTNILVDAGPDFRIQMLRAKCSSVSSILLTHLHYDHVGGLDDVRGLNLSMKKAVDIYANRQTADAVRRVMPYVFVENKYPGVPNMNLYEVDEESFEASGVLVEPIPVMHGKMPILGYRIGNWAYITDASYISEESMTKLQGLDVLILNALRFKEHPSHFSVEESLAIVEQLKPRRTYFTHFSHEIGLHSETQKKLPPNVYLAYDGLIVE